VIDKITLVGFDDTVGRAIEWVWFLYKL